MRISDSRTLAVKEDLCRSGDNNKFEQSDVSEKRHSKQSPDEAGHDLTSELNVDTVNT